MATRRNRTRFNRHRLGLGFEKLETRRLLAVVPSDIIWDSIDDIPESSKDQPRPVEFSSYVLNDTLLQSVLEAAPLEFTSASPSELLLPSPDGRLQRFGIVESPIVEPVLAAKLPDVATYRGKGIGESTATVRLTVSPLGLHAQIRSAEGTYYVDPYGNHGDNMYLSYYARDLPADPSYILEANDIDEVLEGHHAIYEPQSDLQDAQDPPPTQTTGPDLLTYRLAVAATGEFTTRHGGTVALAQATIVQAINDVNGIYEDEFSMRFTLVDNTSIVYVNAATDPYTNSSNSTMLGQNQANLDNVIGSANYDIGHVFGTAGGGVASVAVAGVNGLKARGVSSNNLNFSSQTVAHEIGHQFSSRHTWNGANGSCTPGQWNADFSMEPGSGSTILSYGGFCGVDNVQTFRDDYFHSVSFDAIVNHAKNTIPSVGTKTSTGNSAPIVSAGPDYTIPSSTPFQLTGSATDPDGDTVNSNWEQRDLGLSQKALAAPDDGLGPLFRSYPRTSDPSRTIPRLPELLSNTTPLGEQLPTTNRNINFRLNALDGFGGVASDAMVITVKKTGASFAITSPNTAVTFPGVSAQTVTWNVAGTTGNGIDTANVNILLSTDGGNTFPIVLASSVPNDGSHTVVLPGVNTASARIKVEGDGNIFFDVSNTNFMIGTSSTLVCNSLEDFDGATAPNLPASWATTSTNSNDWVTVGSGSDSAPNHAFVANVGATSDNRLTSPTIAIPSTVSQLQFRNYYDMEDTYDGGVLEISIGGGGFNDILDAGGSFVSGGYTDFLGTGFGNPLGGRNAWSGDSGGFIDTVVNLPSAAIGNNVQLRWREGTDSSVPATGWRIDSIELCGAAFDYGDAPDGTFPTLSANNGAAHGLGGPLFLGAAIDAEPDGQPNATASGDDDDGGNDDDGVGLPASLEPGTSASVTVEASVALGLLNAWVDFNDNGSWADPGEQIFTNQPLNAGTNNLNFPVPASATLTAQTFARFRLSTQSGLSYDGPALDGEVEDYVVEIANPVMVVLPSGGGANDIVIRKNGSQLEVYDVNGSTTISSTPLAGTSSLTIQGSDTEVDQILVDYTFDGFFSLPGGIFVSGGSGASDALTVTGTGTTQAVYSVAVSPAGQTQLSVTEGASSDLIRYADFDSLNFGGLQSFAAVDALSVGLGSLAIGSTTPAELSSMTLLGGGSLSSSGGLVLGAGETVTGFGTLSTPNDLTKALTNHGSISGNSASQQIVLPGYLDGAGALTHVELTGTYSPGASPAIVNHGSVTYEASSNTIIEVGGTAPGSSGHDQLNHSGDITINGGTLDVQWISSFVPAYGDVLAVVTWDGVRTGEFSGYAGELVTSSIAVIPRYDANQLSLVTTGLGDANLDGQTSFADFLVLQNNFGAAGDWTTGDFNFDGTVSFADFLVLQNNFGNVYFT